MWTRGLRLRDMNFCPELLFEAIKRSPNSGQTQQHITLRRKRNLCAYAQGEGPSLTWSRTIKLANFRSLCYCFSLSEFLEQSDAETGGDSAKEIRGPRRLSYPKPEA